jgi:hypothetical protein
LLLAAVVYSALLLVETVALSRPETVVTSTATTLTGSAVPGDLIAALNTPARSTETGISLPDGTHKFTLEAFVDESLIGGDVQYATTVPSGKTLRVQIRQRTDDALVREWVHVGAGGITTQTVDITDLTLSGNYDLWLVVEATV